jgi:hypothetical protein
MTSDRKIAANRRNASRSTGPRSAAGKARSSRNALRHGLTISLANDTSRSAEIQRLAHAIAGTSDPSRFHFACQAAQAELEILRVRVARAALINHVTNNNHSTSEPQTMRVNWRSIERLSWLASSLDQEAAAAVQSSIELLRQPRPAKSKQPDRAFARIASKLAKYDRYEYGAILRRRRALRELDSVGEPQRA